MEFKDLWDIESAMKVLTHETVDGKTWAEAVEWLLLYGPEEIRHLLLESSTNATQRAFPQLKPSSFTLNGQPCYTIDDLARALHMEKKETQEILLQKEAKHGSLDFVDELDDSLIH